jgi:hypothetical protein
MSPRIERYAHKPYPPVRGRHCAINVQATIGHDCRLGDFSVISSGARVSGHATLMPRAFISANAVVRLASCVLACGWLFSGLVLFTSGCSSPIRDPEGQVGDVRHFGAIGDGRTDDTAAIQGAIDSASSLGGVVRFPPGRYAYQKLLIKGKTGLTISGDHASLIEILGEGGLTIAGSPGFRVTGLTFDHASHNGYILDITSPNVCIDGNTFENLGDGTDNQVEAAIYIGPGSDHALIQNNWFSHLTSGPAGIVRGLYIDNFRNKRLASYDARVLNNRFDTLTPAVDADGVVIDQQGFSSRAMIAGNTFYNCSKRAVKLLSNDNVVRNNVITVDGLKRQSYSAVSSYGDRNYIIGNHAKAVGCSRGCSFYCAWELSGNDNVLADNEADNPAGTTDGDIDCVSVVRAGSQRGGLTNIVVRGNTCRTFRYIRVREHTPIKNLVIEGNTLMNCISQSAIAIYPQSPVNGLSLTHNVVDAGKALLVFYDSGAAGKANFDIDGNTGVVDLNLGDDPMPATIKLEATALSPEHGVQVCRITSGRKWARGSGPPKAGYWRVGDVVYDAKSGKTTSSGWKCISAGVPGSWRRFGPR